jgi:hypothetical protein
MIVLGNQAAYMAIQACVLLMAVMVVSTIRHL